MKIKHLKIERFRGIKLLDWRVPNNIVCLIGPGDSTKSTILDAIEYVLSPTYYIPFTDIDFYNVDTTNSIEITVTVGEIPEDFDLFKEEKFGLFKKGWKSETGILDEPDDMSEVVLSIKLKIDENLEPEWSVIKFEGRENKLIGHKDRAKLGVVKLGHEVNQHLSWGWNSAISKLTEDSSGMKSMLYKSLRQAQNAVDKTDLEDLNAVAKIATEAGLEFGIKPNANEYKPGLDVQSISISTGSISLHDNKMPLKLLGFGSKRLLALALQKQSVKEGAIILIDEIEHGLEPHRVRQLCKTLKQSNTIGQVIMTSHSPSPILEYGTENICVIRNIEGTTIIKSISADLQDITRKYASALLAKRIIVCEGKTEVGICRGLDEYWAKKHNNTYLAHLGVDPIDGNGTNAPEYTMKFRKLGYDVAFFVDSDNDIPNELNITSMGIKIIKWDKGNSIETQICNDIPWLGLKEILSLAVTIKFECEDQSMINALVATNKEVNIPPILDIEQWINGGISENQIREIIGKTAKKGKWFKDIEPGVKLANLIINYLPSIPNTTLAKNITALDNWIHGN